MYESNMVSLHQPTRTPHQPRPKTKPYRSNRRTVFPQLHKSVTPVRLLKPLTSLAQLLAISHIQHNRTRRIVDSYMNDHNALRILPVRDIILVASNVAKKVVTKIAKGPAPTEVARVQTEVPRVTKSKSVRPYRKFHSEIRSMEEGEAIMANTKMHQSFTEACEEEELPGKRTSSNLNRKMPLRCLIEKQEKSERQMFPQKYEKYEKMQLSRSLKLPTCYFYNVPNGGNNQQLVRDILNLRTHWKPLQKPHQPSLKWLPSIQNFSFKKLQSHGGRMINHFQRHHQISTKNNLIKNLQAYCESRQTQLFSVTPVTFVIDFDDEYCEYNLRQFLLFFMQNLPKKVTVQQTNPQPTPHNPNKGVIGDFLKQFVPYMSWQGSQVKRQINPLSKPVLSPCYGNNYIWLLKPTGLNRGRGIQIFNSVDKLKQILLGYMQLNKRKKFQIKTKKTPPKKIIIESESENQEAEDHSLEQHSQQPNPQSPTHHHEQFHLKTCSFVVQKYIQKPLLINDRKFDIRIWAMLRQDMNLYFFKEGYLRLSSEKYSLDISNYFVHLTNNAVQQHCSKYGNYQSGNQLGFGFFKEFVNSGMWQSFNEPPFFPTPSQPNPTFDCILTRMKELVYMSMSSVRAKVNPHRRKHCFQIFGYDFFVDCSLKVWLIEVNTNPCIQTSSPLLKMLIPRMLNDAFKLTIDQVFKMHKSEPQPIHHPIHFSQNIRTTTLTPTSPTITTFPVAGYSDSENMWECLGKLGPNSEYKRSKPSEDLSA